MKKTLIIIIIAFLLGASLSFITVFELKDHLNLFWDENLVTAFQIGVYKSKENASKIAEEYPNSITIQDGEYYRVYVGVAASDSWIESLETYFLDKKMNVFPKEVKVTSTFFQELNQYESLFEVTDTKTYEQLNGEILKKFAGQLV
ncbi:MAG: SPOR domain-containing protein [Bacilli bacterium]|jgi:hypothetical protein|nr:SPOR domain-containing protein [Bacilli bacterium]